MMLTIKDDIILKISHFVIIFLVLFSFHIHANSTLGGPTGLIVMPTAESLKYKEFNVGGNYLFPAGNNSTYEYVYKLNLGTFQNWEIGAVGGKTPTEGMYLNVKYYLMSSESELPLFIAIGLQNISSSQKTDLYMVASKKLREDLGLHLGFKAIFNTKITPVFMAGINYIVSDKLEVLADLSPSTVLDNLTETYIVNIGANYKVSSTFTVNAHLLDIASKTAVNIESDLEEGGMRIVLGVTYSKFL